MKGSILFSAAGTGLLAVGVYACGYGWDSLAAVPWLLIAAGSVFGGVCVLLGARRRERVWLPLVIQIGAALLFLLLCLSIHLLAPDESLYFLFCLLSFWLYLLPLAAVGGFGLLIAAWRKKRINRRDMVR